MNDLDLGTEGRSGQDRQTDGLISRQDGGKQTDSLLEVG
jgi:hypothetical protein